MTAPRPSVLPAHPAMFAALAVPNFRRYVSGQALILIGTWVETVAQALLVLRLTHSGTVLGLTTAARYAPVLLLGVPAIIRPLLMMALVGTFTFEFEVSLPAETTFHGTGTTYSALIGALGAGAVVGGLYAARSPRTGVARLVKAAVGYAIAVGLVAVALTLATAIAACVLAGVASVIFLTTGNATIQLASDPEYRGRVTALWSMALVGSTPIGSPVIGALSEAASPRYALGLGAAACLAAAIIGGWPGGGLRHNAIALVLQANAIRSLNVPSISTTAFTATDIDLFSGLVTWSLTAHSARRLTASVAAMAAGACPGDLMLSHAHPYAPVVPAVVTAVVIVIAWAVLKPRVTSGPAGAQGRPVQQAVK